MTRRMVVVVVVVLALDGSDGPEAAAAAAAVAATEAGRFEEGGMATVCIIPTAEYLIKSLVEL